MIAFLLSKQGAALAGIVALAGLLTFSHVKAYQAGAAAERVAAMERSMELIRKRSETNEEVNDLDDAGLCAALGGRWVQPEQRCE